MQAAARHAVSRADATDARPTVLFVDDEPRVLNSMRIMFRRHYRVVLADGGAKALDILRRHPVDVIVADHRMPSMTGVELLSEVRELSPRTVRILLTGYADLEAIEGSINDGEVFRFLTKPCQAAELRATVGLAAEIAADSTATPAEPEPVDSPAEPAAAESPLVSVVPTTRQGSVLVYTTDSALAEITREALPEYLHVHHCANLVHVIDTLETDRPGVLFTDISGDREVIEQMTVQLKQHLPELVTVVASNFSDSSDLIRLINCGQIFRYLRKPVTPGRLRVSVNAAVTHHRKLLDNPSEVRRHAVDSPGPQPEQDAGVLLSLMSRIHDLRRNWLGS